MKQDIRLKVFKVFPVFTEVMIQKFAKFRLFQCNLLSSFSEAGSDLALIFFLIEKEREGDG